MLDTRALYPAKRMKHIKPIYVLVKGRITFPLSQVYKLLITKLLILSKGLATPSKYLEFLSCHLVHIKQRGIMVQTHYLIFPTLAPLHAIKSSMTFLEMAHFNPNQESTQSPKLPLNRIINEKMINRPCILFSHTTPVDNNPPPLNQISNSKNLAFGPPTIQKNSHSMEP